MSLLSFMRKTPGNPVVGRDPSGWCSGDLVRAGVGEGWVSGSDLEA